MILFILDIIWRAIEHAAHLNGYTVHCRVPVTHGLSFALRCWFRYKGGN